MLYRFFIGYRFHFRDTSKPAQTKHVQPIRKVIGFSRLACRERSERNAKREKTYIIFAGGTDAKIIKSISEGNTACSFLQEERMQKIIKSISEGNTACSFLQEERMQKLLNPFPKEIPLVPFLQEERMQIRNYRFSFFAGGTDANKEKTYIFFAGGTDAKNHQSISEGNTACSLFY